MLSTILFITITHMLYIQAMGTLADEVALFWGIDYFNTTLLQADGDQVGSLNTDTFEQGYRLIHIKQRVGFPVKNIFRWWELWNASPGHFPRATKWYLQFKTDLLQNHSSNSFHIHNTSHLILMNKLPGLINFLYFFFPGLPNGWWCIICLLLMYMKFYVFVRVFLSYVQERVCISSHSISLWSML